MLKGFYCRFIRKRAFLIALTFVGLTTACQESFDQSLEREAREYTNRHCPQEVETGTILDSLVYNPQKRELTYFYSISATNECIFREKTPLLHELLKQRTINDVTFKDVKDHGVAFRYLYQSEENGNVVYQTLIKAQEYGWRN